MTRFGIRLALIVLTISVFGLLTCWVSGAQAACSGSGTTWNCTAGTTSSQITTALNSATDGATLTFAAGSYNWSSFVSFSNSKGATLICASAGACVVTPSGTVLGMNGSLSGTNTKLYRISGFSFQNAPSGSILIWFYGPGTLSQVRIDHNTFANWGSDSMAVLFGEQSTVGKFYGVIDHNTFSGPNNIQATKVLGALSPSQWPASVRGTSQNMFVEDNLFDFSSATNLGSGCIDSWSAATIVFRHNDTKNCLVTAHGVSHGTTINFEVYLNILRRTANSGGWEDGTRLIHHQGSGEMFIWGNTFYPTGALSGSALGITHYRSASPAVAGYSASLGRCDGTQSRDGNFSGQLGYPCWFQPGRAPTGGGAPSYGALSPVYAWMNVDGSTGNRVPIDIENPWDAVNPSVSDHIRPDRDYYDAVSRAAQTSPTSPFNGTTGMGFGTLANRPATCSTNVLEAGGGVGYFATDQGAQGTLYRCSATNTWTVHYTPYTYPHPLASGGGAPTAPTNLTIQ